jgi:hypothetical protein
MQGTGLGTELQPALLEAEDTIVRTTMAGDV